MWEMVSLLTSHTLTSIPLSLAAQVDALQKQVDGAAADAQSMLERITALEARIVTGKAA